MSNEENWLAIYTSLREHVEAHGHLTDRHTQLNHWWKYQKKRKEGKLTEEQCQLLDELLSLRTHEHTGGRKKIYDMKVYLDNNIIVSLENGDYQLSTFLRLDDIEYYYSAAHVEELIEGKSNPKISVERRLATISELTGANHILNGFLDPEFYPKSIREMYALACTPLHSMLREHINTSTNNFNVDNDRFLEILKLKRIEVNNINPSDIIQEIDSRMLEADDPAERISVEEYLKRSEAIGRSLYCTLFNLLDFACFHKDKPTSHSNIARMHDASHAYYAQLCDVFVSDDKRMRYKTEAVYHYLGVNTRVMNGPDYVTEFGQELEP